METVVLGVTFGVLVGLCLGLLGAGGSIITVPILVYALDLTAHEASGTSLIIVGAVAITGAYSQIRAKRADVRTGVVGGVSGIAGAFLGARLNAIADGELILFLLGILCLAASIRMGLSIPRLPDRPEQPARQEALLRPKVIIAGLVLGTLSGFFGIGGGFLVVPLLVLYFDIPMRWASGTSLMVISINSIAGFLGHLSFGTIRFDVAGPMLGAGVIGVLGGTRLTGRVNERPLRGLFALMLIGISGYLIVRNAWYFV